MSNVINFQAALEKQKEQEEEKRIMQYGIDLVAEMTMEERLEFLVALQTKDIDRYMSVTETIAIRRALRESNND